MRRHLAATRRDPETASGRHHQGPSSPKTIQPPVRRRVGTAAVVAAAAAAGLVDDIKQRPKRGSKTAAQPKKPTPLRSRPPPQLPSSALHAKTGTNMGGRKKVVCYIPYTRYRRRRRRKKKGVAEFVVTSRGRSVGIGWRGGLEERTNERTLWQQQPQCGHPVVGGGGEVTQRP